MQAIDLCTPWPLPCPPLPLILIGFPKYGLDYLLFQMAGIRFYGFSLGWPVRESSLGIFPLWFSCLVQLVLIVYCAGIILVRLSSGALVILIGFKLSSLLGFTLIFVRILTWGSIQYLSSPPDIGFPLICLEYLFIGSNRSCRSDGGLMSFCWCSDGLTADNVEFLVKLYYIMC